MIQLAPGIVASAHQGEHRARVRIQRHQGHLRLRTFQHLGLVFLAHLDALGPQLFYLLVHQLDAVLHRLRRGLLQVRIQRRVNAVRAVIQLVLAVFADERVPHHVHEVRSVAGFHIRRSQLQRSRLRLVSLLTRYGVRVHHRLQHEIAAIHRSFGMPVGRQVAGPLNQPGQQCRLGQCNVLQILPKIGLRCLREPANRERPPLPQVHPVRVKLENLLL